MSTYLFIESRDPFESRDTRFIHETAIDLKSQGHEVIVYLVQNGAFAARQNRLENPLGDLRKAGVTLLADDFSLCERGINNADIVTGIQISNINTLVEALVQDNTKAIWH